MKNSKTLILSRENIENLVDIKRVVTCVESVFKEFALGRTLMPSKVYLNLSDYDGDFRAMPAFCVRLRRCALKWVNVHPGNKKIGLPTVMAVVILSDPKNGLPLCIMDGTCLTSLRTGASGAVAAKYLARRDSHVVSLVGCGVQAKSQILALRELFKINEIKVWGYRDKEIRMFINQMRKYKMNFIATKSVKDCVCESDVIVTTTPSRKPIIKLSWLKKGIHINAIGADAKGKQELEPAILKKAKIVIDDWQQASHSGEINVALRKRIISKKNIYAHLGDIILGKKKGRKNENEMTVFDSTGLAIQDVAVADLIYKTAREMRKGRWVQII